MTWVEHSLLQPKQPYKVLYNEFETIMNTKNVLGYDYGWHYLLTKRTLRDNPNPLDYISALISSYRAGFLPHREFETARRRCYRRFWNLYVRNWTPYSSNRIMTMWGEMWTMYNKEVFKNRAYAMYKNDIERAFIMKQKKAMHKTFKTVMNKDGVQMPEEVEGIISEFVG